jgi:hypothetical protein
MECLTSYSVGGVVQVKLLAGDYVEFIVGKDFNTGASTDNIFPDRTFMEIKKIGNY